MLHRLESIKPIDKGNVKIDVKISMVLGINELESQEDNPLHPLYNHEPAKKETQIKSIFPILLKLLKTPPTIRLNVCKYVDILGCDLI